MIEYPKTPADEEWERLVAEAQKSKLILVQVSDRKYLIGTLRYIRASSDPFVVPWVQLEKNGGRYTWSEGTEEMVRRLRLAIKSSDKPETDSGRSS